MAPVGNIVSKASEDVALEKLNELVGAWTLVSNKSFQSKIEFLSQIAE